MCAIAGEIQFNKKASLKNTLKMLDGMLHRGPDGQGTYLHKNTALGMNRLAIVDLETGNQPLYNEQKDIVVVGNGEIYNYIELQKQLSRKAHHFSSKSDIETVVHLYEEYGANFVTHLRGMFAVAIYDSRKQKIILARDRFGEKPLYYSHLKDKFVFSSELHGIFSISNSNFKIDSESIAKYFYYAFIPEPDSIFENIKRLEPATLLEIDIAKHELKKYKYWDFPEIKNLNNASLSKKIKESISEAIKISTRADVPIGISLSGGLDSATLAAFSGKRKHSTQVLAFSIGYEGRPKNDERADAREIAKKFNLEFIEDEISPKEFIDDFPDLVLHQDEPVSDLAAYPIYRIAKLARSHKIKVLLTGLGGDELFWGYPSVREIASSPDLDNDLYLYFPPYARTLKFTQFLFTNEFKNIYDKRNLKTHKRGAKIALKPQQLAQDTISKLCDGWLNANSLTLADRLGMANSVEMRAPLLDYKLSEVVTGNKLSLNAFKKGHKFYLVRSIKNIIPKSILNRPKKAFTPHAIFWLPRLIFKYIYLLNDGYLVHNKVLLKSKVKFLIVGWLFFPKYWEAIYQILVLEVWFRQTIWKQKINL